MYAAFFRSAFQTRLTYRGQVMALVLYGLITVLSKIAIWISIYSQLETGVANGVLRDEMVTYAVLAGMVLNWDYTRFLQTLGHQIKSGDVATFLLKPVYYPLILLAAECGNFAFGLLCVQLPITIVAGLMYGLTAPASALAGVMAVVFWGLGFVILFLLSSIAAVLAFWLLTVFSLEWVLMALMTIFAGGAIPLWFFPQAAADVIQLLPFSFVAYHPMAVYLGKVDGGELVVRLLFGAGWAVILAMTLMLIWSRTQRRIVVHGG